MIFCQEVLDFKSEIGSAMEDLVPWDMLVTLMNDLCSSLEISKEVNMLLLNELKTFKPVKNEVLETEDTISKFDDNEVKIELEKDVEISSRQYESEENLDQSLSKTEDIFEDEIDDSKEFENENQYSCKKCSKSFKTKHGYLQHNYHVHEKTKEVKPKPEKVACEKCGLLFKSSQSLKHHVSRIHKKENRFQCDICSKIFGDKNTMILHKKSIHEKLTLVCDQCGSKFNWEKTLKHHIRTVHEGFVPFECKDCGKTFNRKQFYTNHVLMVHKGINPYVCEFCDKVFTQAHMMKKHMKNKTCQRK